MSNALHGRWSVAPVARLPQQARASVPWVAPQLEAHVQPEQLVRALGGGPLPHAMAQHDFPAPPLDAPSLAQREASVAPRTPARPPSAPGPRARLAQPRESHLPRFGVGGKRAADAREDLERRLGQWGRWRCRNSVAIALSDERRCASSGRRRSRFHGRGRGRARRFSASCGAAPSARARACAS